MEELAVGGGSRRTRQVAREEMEEQRKRQKQNERLLWQSQFTPAGVIGPRDILVDTTINKIKIQPDEVEVTLKQELEEQDQTVESSVTMTIVKEEPIDIDSSDVWGSESEILHLQQENHNLKARVEALEAEVQRLKKEQGPSTPKKMQRDAEEIVGRGQLLFPPSYYAHRRELCTGGLGIPTSTSFQRVSHFTLTPHHTADLPSKLQHVSLAPHLEFVHFANPKRYDPNDMATKFWEEAQDFVRRYGVHIHYLKVEHHSLRQYPKNFDNVISGMLPHLPNLTSLKLDYHVHAHVYETHFEEAMTELRGILQSFENLEESSKLRSLFMVIQIDNQGLGCSHAEEVGKARAMIDAALPQTFSPKLERVVLENVFQEMQKIEEKGLWKPKEDPEVRLCVWKNGKRLETAPGK